MALHPRPQLARAHWIDLTGPWGFAYDDQDKGLSDCWQRDENRFARTITVPFPPESPASAIGDTGFHPIVWYRRAFETPRELRGQLVLHFGAVDYHCQVWINGQPVIAHEGGHTPFSVDITPALQPGGVQVVVVRAEDVPDDPAQPRGKQDWKERPHDIWYHRTTGIWQPVWLEVLSPTHITSARWTPDTDGGLLGVAIGIRREADFPILVRIQLRLHDVSLLDNVYPLEGDELVQLLSLDAARTTMSEEQIVWSPEHPNLIEATITLLAGGDEIDRVESYTGLRTAQVSNGRFLLNNQPYYLRMVLEQGYWPESHLAAPSEDALRREVELTKALGFNGIRIHQKVEDPRFLYWCDRLGLLVWSEMANARSFSRDAIQKLTHEWLDVVMRDISHPCIVAWVPMNESWGAPDLLQDAAQRDFVRALFHLTKALDSTRPAIANDGWEYLLGDIFGVHDYSFDGDTLRLRYGSDSAVDRTVEETPPGDHILSLSGKRPLGVPLMLTEFGGISYRPEPGADWYGYGTVANREEFVAKYRELVDAVYDCVPIAGFCYTQLTDTAQETNGLLTEFREPKIDPARIRAINRL